MHAGLGAERTHFWPEGLAVGQPSNSAEVFREQRGLERLGEIAVLSQAVFDRLPLALLQPRGESPGIHGRSGCDAKRHGELAALGVAQSVDVVEGAQFADALDIGAEIPDPVLLDELAPGDLAQQFDVAADVGVSRQAGQRFVVEVLQAAPDVRRDAERLLKIAGEASADARPSAQHALDVFGRRTHEFGQFLRRETARLKFVREVSARMNRAILQQLGDA